MKNISEIAKMKTQSFDADGNLVITDNVLDYLKQQESELAALTTENEKIRELVISQIACERGLSVENDTSQTTTLDLVKTVVAENERLKKIRKYAKHIWNCTRFNGDDSPCSCGLTKLLQGGER
jgi:hypothetical protein